VPARGAPSVPPGGQRAASSGLPVSWKPRQGFCCVRTPSRRRFATGCSSPWSPRKKAWIGAPSGAWRPRVQRARSCARRRGGGPPSRGSRAPVPRGDGTTFAFTGSGRQGASPRARPQCAQRTQWPRACARAVPELRSTGSVQSWRDCLSGEHLPKRSCVPVLFAPTICPRAARAGFPPLQRG